MGGERWSGWGWEGIGKGQGEMDAAEWEGIDILNKLINVGFEIAKQGFKFRIQRQEFSEQEKCRSGWNREW